MSRKNNKAWKDISSVLSEILNQTLDENSTDLVMREWNDKEETVSKHISNGQEKTNTKTSQKDPLAPKKWITGYIFFCMDHRKKLKSENSSLNAVQITSLLGKAWKSLSEKDKKHYEELSQQDKIRYEKEMQNYSPEQKETTKKTRKRAKNENNPKRPLTAYMFFCQEKRPEVRTQFPSLNGTQITTELGKMWKLFSPEQKLPYEEKQKQDKIRYTNQKKEIHSEKESSESNKEKEVKTTKLVEKETKKEEKTEVQTEQKSERKKEKTHDKKEKKEKKLVKKSLGYEYFVKDQTEELETENPDWNHKKIESEVVKRWKELSAEDKKAYEQEALAIADEEAELELN